MSQEIEVLAEGNDYVVTIPEDKDPYHVPPGDAEAFRKVLKAAEARGFRLCEEARKSSRGPMIGN